MTILVFPSSIESSLSLLDEARRWAPRVIGASALENDPNAARFDGWERLPYIGEQGFFAALSGLVERERVTRIATSHAPTFFFLTRNLAANLRGIDMVGESPYRKQVQWVAESLAGVREQAERVWTAIGQSSPIDLPAVTAMLAQAARIFGECSNDKALGLCAVFSAAPTGDVIEIGTFFGKSAYLLNRLSVMHGIGATITIDPWKAEYSVQHDSPAFIQELTGVWDWEKVYQGFLLNMQACHVPPFNYVRAPSERAWESYASGGPIRSREFGTTPIAGRIAVLHIDGNHDEKVVRRDFELWSRRLAPGAWVIFDDYEWSQGEGPRKAADEVIGAYGGRIERRFIAGGALFLQMKR